MTLLRRVLRDSDIPAVISDWEFLAVLRDVDPQRAFVVAQRFLASAGESDELREAGLLTRVGYVIYPLSPQPNLPVDRWHLLLDLARHMSERGRTTASACGSPVARSEPGRNRTGVGLRRRPERGDADRAHPADSGFKFVGDVGRLRAAPCSSCSRSWSRSGPECPVSTGINLRLPGGLPA
jgi:hypothetical protein